MTSSDEVEGRGEDDVYVEQAEQLFERMNDLCHEQPAAVVIYALAMMIARAVRHCEDSSPLETTFELLRDGCKIELRKPISPAPTNTMSEKEEKAK